MKWFLLAVALGVGGWAAGLFHLITHAFFKSLLFMCSGSVIHATHTNEMPKMGGLLKKMPYTGYTMLVGCLAIIGAGVPFVIGFSGYYSKDAIVAQALSFSQSNPFHGSIFFYAAVGGASITAFYMFRSVYLTFDGQERFDHHHVHPHESPASMTVPLWILAVLSTLGGFLGLPGLLGEHANVLHNWLEPVFEPAYKNFAQHEASHGVEGLLMGISLGIAIAGILLARHFYINRPGLADRVAGGMKGVYKLLWNKWYVDDIYEWGIVIPLQKMSQAFLLRFVDKGIIDGAINGSGRLTAGISGMLRKLQTGLAQNYAMVFVIGIMVIIGWLVWH